MKLICNFFVLVVLILAVQDLSFAAGNLLKNPEWRQLDLNAGGRPVGWVVRGGNGSVICRDGVAVLRRTGTKVPFLCQYNLPLLPFLNQAEGEEQQRYRCSVEVMGAPGAVYRFYVEEYGKGASKAYGKARPVPAPEKWQTVSFAFTPRFSAGRNVLALTNAGAAGEIRFRNLKLELLPAPQPSFLKNPTWKKLDCAGAPLQWRVRGGAGSVVCRDGMAVLRRTTDVVPFLFQPALPLEKSRSYRCSVEVMGTPGARYRFYVEELFRKKRHAYGRTKPVLAPEQWERVFFDFSPAFPPKSALVALTNPGENGEVRFRNLKLEGIASAAKSFLQNSEWRELDKNRNPLHWQVRGGAGAVVCRDGLAVLRRTTAKVPFLVQQHLLLEKGRDYHCSVEVMGTPGAKYRFYVEEVQKKRSHAYGSAKPVAAPADWQKVSFSFAPAFPPKHALLALTNAGAEGEVRFRKLKLTEAQDQLILGRPVKLSGRSLVDASDHQHPAAVVAYVDRTTAGAVVTGVPVKPGRYYELRYQVKGMGAAQNDTNFHFFDVRIDLKDGSELLRSTWEDVPSRYFVPKSFVFKVPEKHVGGVVDLGLGVANGSTVAFRIDSLRETIIKPADFARLVLTSPVYHKGIFATRPVSRVEGFAEMKGAKGRAEFKVLHQKKVLAESAADFVRCRAGFSFDAGLFREGRTEIRCSIFDHAGKKIREFTETVTRYPRSRGQEIVIGQDKQFYVNGKPFFPIMQYGMRPRHLPYEKQMDINAISYVAGTGSNVFLASPSIEKETMFLLDTALQHKAMIILSTKYIRGLDTPENCLKWKKAMQTLLTEKILLHPALFGFYLADEPRWNGVPAVNLQKSARILQEIDPYHPILIVAAPRGSVEDHLPYAEAADFYGIDIYPVPVGGSHSNLDDRGLTCVGKYARRVEAMVEKRKPVMMVLQGFAWGELRMPAKRIYPTLAESRFMAYNSLLNGGTHVAYYAYNHVINPQLIDDIGCVTKELHEMAGLLVTGKTIAEREEKGLQYRIMEWQGRRYAIAVNNTPAAVNATVPAGFRTSEVLEMGKKCRVPVRNGSVSAEMPPYGVCVYGEDELPPPLYQLKESRIPNPWIRYTEYRELLDKLKYTGKASWIWDAAGTEIALSKVYFARILQVRKPVREMVIYASADNMATVWFNGRKIGENDQWKTMKKMTVEGSQFRNGENVITVYAQDGFAPPCAFLADITIRYADGTSENIITDRSWLCTMKKLENWMDAKVIRQNFRKVDYLVPYGQGAWGSRVMKRRISEVLGK